MTMRKLLPAFLMAAVCGAFAVACFLQPANAAPYSIDSYTGTGTQTAYAVTFPYISQNDVKVTINGSLTAAYTWTSPSQITFTTAPPSSAPVVIQRFTQLAYPEVTFRPGSLASRDLNIVNLQMLYLHQERTDAPSSGTYLAVNNNLLDVQIPSAALNNLGGLPHVANNAGLSALASTAFSVVVRDGFLAPGDATPLAFHAGSAACSLNAGAGDGASQVASLDSKCWLATFAAGLLDVREWGAKCDNATNDATVFSSSLTFAATIAPAAVTIPPGRWCDIGATLTVPQDVTLQGYGWQSGGLKPSVVNMGLMIHLAANGSSLKNLNIVANAAGVNTSGTTIDTAVASYNRIEDVLIDGPCIGVDLGGNTQWVNRVVVDQYKGAGCGGMRLGHLTTLGATTDTSILETTLVSDQATPADYDLEIQDAGGLFMHHLSTIFGAAGTVFKPGLNQQIDWPTISDSYLGDSTVGHPAVFDTADATGVIKGLQCNSCWFGSAGSSGLLVQNTAGGTIAGLNFNGARIFGAAANGADILAGTNVNFDGAHVCGSGQFSAATNIHFGTGVSTFAVRNSEVGGGCDGVATGAHLVQAFAFDGSNSGAIITGNDLTGAPTAFGNLSNLTSSLVDNNLGVAPAGSAVTVTASPFTHIAGPQPETDYISGGTVSAVTTTGVTACSSSPCAVNLGPNESLTVTYTGAPTINRVTH